MQLSKNEFLKIVYEMHPVGLEWAKQELADVLWNVRGDGEDADPMALAEALLQAGEIVDLHLQEIDAQYQNALEVIARSAVPVRLVQFAKRSQMITLDCFDSSDTARLAHYLADQGLSLKVRPYTWQIIDICLGGLK
jgi:hypothetical protein